MGQSGCGKWCSNVRQLAKLFKSINIVTARGFHLTKITKQYGTTEHFLLTYFLFEHRKNIEQRGGHSVIWMCQAARCYQPELFITITQQMTTYDDDDDDDDDLL